MADFFIVGADAAGLSAAIQIKSKQPGSDIQVINKGSFISYGACGIPYVLSGDIPSASKLIHFTPQKFAEKRGITVETKKEAIDIFPEENQVSVKDLETQEIYQVDYGKLLIATGAAPKKLPFLDYSMEGIFDVHDIADLERILVFMETNDPQHIAIIGAGNVGLELTEAMHKRGKNVTLFEILEYPVMTFPPSVQKAVLRKIQEKGVRFFGSTPIQSVEKNGDKFLLHAGGKETTADMIFSVVGIQPATEFCRDKLDCLGNGALVIERTGQTSDKNIFAAGDCATAFHKILQRNVYFPLGTTANRMGRVAGLNMAGDNILFPGILGTQIFKFFELSLAKTGLSQEAATREGIEIEIFSAQRMDRAGYYPHAAKASVDIVCEKGTGKLLGAAAVCEGNAAQFIDPAAVAVFCGMSVKDLGWFDAAYTPPYAPVWNALVSAALKAAKT